MADLQKIVDDLSTLTVLEAAELAKLLEEKWGVSAAAAVAVAAGPAAGALVKFRFNVLVTGVDIPPAGAMICARAVGAPMTVRPATAQTAVNQNRYMTPLHPPQCRIFWLTIA